MRKTKSSPLLQEIEDALDLGSFVDYRHSSAFISGMEAIKGKIDQLLPKDAQQAVNLFEVFIAGCYEKANEVDDSSGDLGLLVEDLFCGWIKAAQAAGVSPDHVARRILQWQKNDEYGFCHEIWKQLVPVLNAKGKAAYRKLLEERSNRKIAELDGGDKADDQIPGEVRNDLDALKAVMAAQKDYQAYRQLCEQTGLSPGDCLALAQICESKKCHEKALEWADQGLKLRQSQEFRHSGDYELEPLKRRLLQKLGRSDEALQDAWEHFREGPSPYTYDDLMEFVPPGQRTIWQEKALSVADTTKLDAAIELLVKFKENERLADRIEKASHEELTDLSHYRTEPAAKALRKSHPLAAAKVFRALGMRILESRKSKYYHIAHDHFEHAKKLYEASGHPEEWQRIVAVVRAEHKRKSGFMEDFERIVAGHGPSRPPTFKERIQERLRRTSNH